MVLVRCRQPGAGDRPEQGRRPRASVHRGGRFHALTMAAMGRCSVEAGLRARDAPSRALYAGATDDGIALQDRNNGARLVVRNRSRGGARMLNAADAHRSVAMAVLARARREARRRCSS